MSVIRLLGTWLGLEAALFVIWIALGGLTGRGRSEAGRGLPTKIASTVFVLAASVSGLSLFSSSVRHVVVEPIAASALGLLEPDEGGSSQLAAAVPSPEAADTGPSEGPEASESLPPAQGPIFFPTPVLSRTSAITLPSNSPTPSPMNCPPVEPSPSEDPTLPPDPPPPPTDTSCPTPYPSPTTPPFETPSETASGSLP